MILRLQPLRAGLEKSALAPRDSSPVGAGSRSRCSRELEESGIRPHPRPSHESAGA